MLKKLVFLPALLIFGCSTYGGHQIEDLNRPLKELQQTVMSVLPEGKRKVSRNGREFFSNYFQPPGAKYDNPNRRYHIHVYILGDRRPYTLEVYARIEEKKSSYGGAPEWSSEGTDQGLARSVARRIKSSLSKRRDNRNMVDDFRVF